MGQGSLQKDPFYLELPLSVWKTLWFLFPPFISYQDFLSPNIILISMSESQRKTDCHLTALSTSKKSFFQERGSKAFLN